MLGSNLPNLNTQIDPQFISALFLQSIYQYLLFVIPTANASGPAQTQPPPSIGFTFDASPVPYRLVNSLWFLSLVLSITCALLAVSLQQWARRYLMAVRRRRTLYSQARIRQFLVEGIRDSGISILVEVMRTGHQLSFVLFAIGLLAYFANIDSVTYQTMLTWFGISGFLYLCMTISGMLRKNSPYHTPLLSIIQVFPRLVLFLYLSALYSTTQRFRRRSNSASNRFERVLTMLISGETREETELQTFAHKNSQELDSRTLGWTFKSLNQDHEFERFFAGIPDFCNSRAVKDPKGQLLKLNDEQKLSQALIGFLHRAVTSHLVSRPARQQMIDICMKAIEVVPIVATWSTLRRVFDEWDGFLGTVDAGSAILRAGSNDPRTIFCSRCIVAIALARAQVYDNRWRDLTAEFLTSEMEVWVSSYTTVFSRLFLILTGLGCQWHFAVHSHGLSRARL